jgi:5-methylcytosine-specific restriction endonuclease McrA
MKKKKTVYYRNRNKWNYNAKLYKEWRSKVFHRDQFCCRICGDKGYIEAHHIRPKSKHPALAYVISNGIALCKYHHAQVTGREEKFIMFFRKILKTDTRDFKDISKEFKSWQKRLM